MKSIIMELNALVCAFVHILHQTTGLFSSMLSQTQTKGCLSLGDGWPMITCTLLLTKIYCLECSMTIELLLIRMYYNSSQLAVVLNEYNQRSKDKIVFFSSEMSYELVKVCNVQLLHTLMGILFLRVIEVLSLLFLCSFRLSLNGNRMILCG